MASNISRNPNKENNTRLIAFGENAKLGVDGKGHLYEVKPSWNPIRWAYRKLFSQNPTRLAKTLRQTLIAADKNIDKAKITSIVNTTFGAESTSAKDLTQTIAKLGEKIDSAHPTDKQFEYHHFTQHTPPPSGKSSPVPFKPSTNEFISDIDTPVSPEIAKEMLLASASKIPELRQKKERIEAEIPALRAQVNEKLHQEMKTLNDLEVTQGKVRDTKAAIDDEQTKLSKDPIHGDIQKTIREQEAFLKRTKSEEKKYTDRAESQHAELIEVAKQELAKNEELLQVAKEIKEADPTAIADIDSLIEETEARINELKKVTG